MGLFKSIIPTLYDAPFDESPPKEKNIAERGYISESELADDERVQRSRANQTRFINDHRERY